MSVLEQVSPVFALLLDAGLKATVVLLGALAATRLMRRRAAAARHLVWSVALAAVLALPALSLVVPAWKALPVPESLRFAPSPSLAPASPPAPLSSDVEQTGGSTAPTVAERAASTDPAPTSTVEAERAGPPVDWRTALLAVWAAGGVLLVVRLAYGLARVAWIERRAVEITDERWVGITDRLARRLRVGRMVTLLRESHASVPMTWGVLRPVVLLPAEADAWDDERRTVVLAHELAHVRRWDPLTQWIAHLALAVFWFHPLVWTAARRMREERERACDDAVLALGTRPASYADHLLQIVRSLGSAEGPAAALAMARRSQFEGRLLAILDGATPRGGAGRGLGIAALAVAAMAVLPLAALRAAEPEARAASAASPLASGDVEDARREAAGPEAPASAPLEPKADAAPDARAEHEPAAAAMVGEQVSAVEEKVATVARELGIDPAKADELRRALRPDTLEDGADAMVRSAESVRDPYSRARVLLNVLARPGLRPSTLTAALRAAAGITSEGDRARVLKAAVASHWMRAPSVQDAFFDAMETMPGGGARRDVLTAALARENVPDAVVRRALEASARLSTSGDRRAVLTAALAHSSLTSVTLARVVDAARGLPSSGDRRALFVSILARPQASDVVVRAVVDAARELPSSGDRKVVLTAALARHTVSEPVLRRMVAVTSELPSCGDKREVLVGLLARTRLSDAVMSDVFGVVRGMTSSGDQRAVMMAAASRGLTERTRAAYLDAARSVDSDADRAAVLMAVR